MYELTTGLSSFIEWKEEAQHSNQHRRYDEYYLKILNYVKKKRICGESELRVI